MLYKKTKRKKRKILKKYLIFFFVLCVALAAVFEYQVKPIQDNFIRTKGKVVVQKCISDAVTKTLEESTNEDFVNISTDGDGTVTAVNTDADSVNRFKSDLESEITASLEKIHTENIYGKHKYTHRSFLRAYTSYRGWPQHNIYLFFNRQL